MPPTRVECVEIFGREFRLHKPLRSFDVLVDEIMTEPDADFPWWGLVWPGAVALAEHLFESAPLSGEAIELGCGLGLAGLAGAAAGLRMLQTDKQPEVLELVRLAARDNMLPMPRTRVLDWTNPGEIVPHPLVLGADILFEDSLHDDLLALLRQLIAPGGRALLTDPRRATSQPFLDAARQVFELQTSERSIVLGYETTMVQLHELTWPGL